VTEGARDPIEQPPPPPVPADQAPGRPSRRAFLIGGGVAVLAGAGAGTGVEFWRDRPHPAPPPPSPTVLLAALAAERALLADLDAALAAGDTDRAALRQLRADHAAHAKALGAAVTQAGGSAAASAGPSASTTPPGRRQPPTTAQLRAAETAAARAAASRAELLAGRDATLLACIAACEAGHAELLG